MSISSIGGPRGPSVHQTPRAGTLGGSKPGKAGGAKAPARRESEHPPATKPAASPTSATAAAAKPTVPQALARPTPVVTAKPASGVGSNIDVVA